MFRIMVVEDDVELRELFCAVLSDHGYLPLPQRTVLKRWKCWSTAMWI